jgi:hypothetical protein
MNNLKDIIQKTIYEDSKYGTFTNDETGLQRMNNYLYHMQLMYMTKFDKKLFNEKMYKNEDGVEIIEATEPYFKWINEKPLQNTTIDKETDYFIKRICFFLEDGDKETISGIVKEDVGYRDAVKENKPTIEPERFIDEMKDIYKFQVEPLYDEENWNEEIKAMENGG